MQLWVRCDCEIEHERYQAGQALTVSEVLGTHLQRCSPESFSTVDPAVAAAALAQAEAERQAAELAEQARLKTEAAERLKAEQAEAAKALEAPPKNKMVEGAPKSK